jgi:hypothetical protein
MMLFSLPVAPHSRYESLQAHEIEGVDHRGQFDRILHYQEPNADADACHEVSFQHLAVYLREKVASAHCRHSSFFVGDEGQGKESNCQETPAILGEALVFEIRH